MSALELKNRLPARASWRSRTIDSVVPLQWYEKALLAIGILEIPLQMDKYCMFHESDADLGAVAGINVSMTTVALACLYLLWLVQFSTSIRSGHNRNILFGLPMLLYIGTVCLSVFAAGNWLLSIFDVALLTQSYLLFFYIANRVRTREDIKFLMMVFLATLLLQSCIILGLRCMGESVWGEPFAIGPVVFSIWEQGRAAGTMHSPVLAGSFLATLWLPAVVIFTLPSKGVLRWAAISGVILGGLAIVVTQTRGAILTSAMGCTAIGLAFIPRGWLPTRLLTIAAVLAVAGIIPMVHLIKARVLEGDGESAVSRIHLSAIAFETIQRKPFFGHGAGNCHLAAKEVGNQAKYRSLWYYTVHNKYLLVWIETGVVGLLAFLGMMFSSVRDGFRVWATKDRFLAPLGFGFAFAILGQMLHMGVDIFNSRTQVQTLWSMLGAIAALRLAAERLPARHAVTGGQHV